MHIYLSYLLLLALVASPVTAQDDKMTEVVKTEVKKMIDATTGGKYEVVVALTHPKVREELGGKEKAGQKIKEGMEAGKAQGFTFEVKEINKPTVVKNKRNYFAVTPYTMVVTGLGKKATLKTAVVGVSTNEGKTWKFVNLAAGGEDEVRRFLPALPHELKVPRQEQTIEDIQ